MKNRLRIITLTAVLILVQMIWSARVQAVTFGGHATGAQVTVPATGTVIRAASGTLAISGGAADAALLVGDIPGSVTGGVVSLAAGTLHSAIVGLDATDAEASMANVSLVISGNQITADFLMAQSTASCAPGPALAGGAELANLVINGQTISITGAPNQTIALSNGTVIINEQTASIVGSSGEVTVTALHVTTRDPVTSQELADAKLSTVDAKIDCQAGSGPPDDFTSGGGWITVEGGKANFGVHAGIRDGNFSGHLVYKDHAQDFRVESTVITSYSRVGCTATIIGQANTNRGGPVQFTVEVTDGGEPGSNDEFIIDVAGVSPPYVEGGTLGGGNIQVHRQTCPTP